ncbi:MAG: DUF3332 domain-containing protein [Muribaculaceae bacterium]|nr:DUF3332 domain-containing protein [Muribaculaceae bacterium]
MKRKVITAAVAALLLFTTVTTPSCIGSFSLTNRLLGWNQHIGNKFLNELVFFAFWVLPVYEVSCLADVIVLNSIEFWSGSNPMAKGEKIIEGNDGRYLVKADDKGYDIISCNDGSSVRLDFNAEDQSWSVNVDGKSHVLFSFVDDTHVRVPVGAGNDWRTVEVSEAGVYAYQQMVSGATYAAR